MAEAVGELEARRRRALPGGFRDRWMGLLKLALPAAAAVLTFALVLIPLMQSRELSFLLSKESVAKAGERMRLEAAMYRGETAEGDPFEVSAADAVQRTSARPVVDLVGLKARLTDTEGPVLVTAPSGMFDMTADLLTVSGPVMLRSQRGWSLDSRTVLVSLRDRTVRTDERVSGRVAVGAFEAGSAYGDVGGRRVVLEGGARLRIRPGAGTGGA
jgi:lipopolysaccharide export system protein LptC